MSHTFRQSMTAVATRGRVLPRQVRVVVWLTNANAGPSHVRPRKSIYFFEHTLQQRSSLREEGLIAERDDQAQYLQALEDRAHQETKEMRSQLAAVQRSSESLRQQLDDAQAVTAPAQREAGVQFGRADAFELQLARLVELPASLQATLAQIQPSTKNLKPSPGKAIEIAKEKGSRRGRGRGRQKSSA